MTEQGLVFLFSCAVGVFLGAIYDVFRIMRIAFNSKWLSVFFQDFMFCIFSALSVILLVFYTNSGIVRWFSLVGCFTSFVVYHLTVGRAIMFMARKIIDLIKRVIDFIWSVTVAPAVRLLRFAAKQLRKFALFMLAQFKRARAHGYYKKARRAAKRAALRGFGLHGPAQPYKSYKSGKSRRARRSASKAVDAEIKKQHAAGRAQLREQSRERRELAKAHAKPRPHRRAGKKTQTLGPLKSLSDIKFK